VSHVPNAETAAAIEAARRGETVKRWTFPSSGLRTQNGTRASSGRLKSVIKLI
jgi:hypothetical protein